MEIKEKEHLILIVDDTPKNIQVLGQVLSEKGYKILVATNGIEALKAVEKKIPDLILLDINMPEMDGYETCEHLKSKPHLATIPIIFLTARTEPEDVIKAFQVGGSDYIAKPFNSLELLARVNLQLNLMDQKKQIQISSENNKQLIRVLLHDLGNPLGAIKTIVQMAESDTSAYEKFSHLLIKSTDNCMDILENVRKMYSVDDQKFIPDLANINLENTIKSCLLIFKHKLDEKNISINLNIPKDVSIRVDGTAFAHSILNNLLTNAIKFSFTDSKIDIVVTTNDTFVTLSVKDFGMGMPENILKNIFDISKPTSRKGTNGEKGTGYGMPLVKKFVEMFGGSIDIISIEKPNPEHGTEVILKFKNQV